MVTWSRVGNVVTGFTTDAADDSVKYPRFAHFGIFPKLDKFDFETIGYGMWCLWLAIHVEAW
jgi:hypothetical protein